MAHFFDKLPIQITKFFFSRFTDFFNLKYFNPVFLLKGEQCPKEENKYY